MKKTSKHINKIVKSLFIFIFLIIAFVIVLANGISIRNLELPNIEITELYIKLDKKLILNANKVYIKKANSNEDININALRKKILDLKEFKQILAFFQNINIKEVKVNDSDKIQVYYDQKHLNISSNDIETNLIINPYLNELLINISSLRYKDLYFYGDLRIAKSIEIKGYLHSKNNDLNAKLNVINSKNDFSLDIEKLEIKNQEKALAHFDKYLKPIMKEWLIDRVKFENFKGSFAFYIKNNKLEKSLGDGIFFNVNVRYNDKAPIAYAKEVKLALNDMQLDITSSNLSSLNNVKVDSFSLNFDNLLRPNILINIQANNVLYNEGIEKIINAYNVFLGLKQTSGTSKANVKISLRNDKKHDVLVNVKSNGAYTFNNLKFNANVNVSVNNKLVNVTGDANTNEIKITNGVFKLDAGTKLASIEAKNLNIDYKEYFNFSDSAKLNLNLNTKTLEFPKLNSTIYLGNDLLIKSKIVDLLPYSKKLQSLKFSNGEIELSSKNDVFFVNITNAMFDFNIYKNNPNNLDNNYKYIKDDFYISIKKDETKITTKSKLVELSSKNNKTIINLNNAIIDANKLDNDKSDNSSIELNLTNSKIFYKDFNLNFEKLNLNKSNYQTMIKATFKNGGELSAKISKDSFLAYIRELSHKTLNEITNKEIFISGEIDLDANGKNLDDFEGLLNVRGAYLANTKNYINLIAFIESVPSIMTLNKPGFTKKGLGIKFGSIEFKHKNNLINIENVNILGYSIDCSGKGIINLNSKTADIVLNIFTLKNTNKIISNIPIVKEIFIGGKDNKIATQLKISGSLDNLEYKTTLAKDILTSPFVLLKNIVTLPKNLIIR
ncbi:AsmA-like C-terminal domain-containing protein [Campylobacter sp. Cr9]|uniref:YhdP family protein n=1 Tax=Campylobacter sp. Cr9 TaxID=2735728 RepID=UPI0030145B68|nr:AsmA-like C-terminal domain-containing protein [Campylobacter sp. Cr9]